MGPQQRPVLPGFHPDPSICRVGTTWYLASSSFEYAPGVPIHTSTDLRSWRLIGHALDRPGQLDVSKAGPSGGIFAPTLRHHDGRFWMITTNWSDDGGQLLVHADDAAGPWSDPVRMPVWGIDPDLAWDDDGTCLMSYAGQTADGARGIVQVAIDPLSGTVLSEPRWIWGGTGGKFPEGPHLYRIGAWWYLLIAEGGTERGHAVTVARSASPSGPFESNPRNPILTHRGTDLPVQNTGHADLAQRADGSWAIVYHGVRARGSSPEWHVLGRETFADDVTWDDGWPVLTRHLEPLAPEDVPVLEQLDGADPGQALPATWVAASRFPQEIVTRTVDGWRVAAPGAETVFVGRRQQHLTARARAQLTVAGVGGLSVRIDPEHAVTVEWADGEARAVWTVGGVRHVLGRLASGPELDVELRMAPMDGHPFATSRGPDTVIAGVVRHGAFVELGRVDGRYLSTEVAGGMTGRLIGIACAAGEVVLRSFRCVGADDAAAVEASAG